jgi:hypothetical protein
MTSPPGRPEAPYGYTLAGTPRKYPRRDPVTGKRPGPTRDRNGPIMETKVSLMRSVDLSAYRIALMLQVRRQSVEQILRRPHVAAMVEDFRTRLRADQALRDWASGVWRGES